MIVASLIRVCAFSTCLPLVRTCLGPRRYRGIQFHCCPQGPHRPAREADQWQTLAGFVGSVWCSGNSRRCVWRTPGLLRWSNFWAGNEQGKAQRSSLQRQRALWGRMRVILPVRINSFMLESMQVEKSPPVPSQISEIWDPQCQVHQENHIFNCTYCFGSRGIWSRGMWA